MAVSKGGKAGKAARAKLTKKPTTKARAKKAAKKPAGKSAGKSPKTSAKSHATRGPKPARRVKAASSSAKAPRGAKARKYAAARRHALARHVPASARRPKSAPQRGLSRARVVSRRRPPERARQIRDIGGFRGASEFVIRDFAAPDAGPVNALALATFEQFQGEHADWPAFSALIASMASLADGGELIVAESDGSVAGAAAYFGPTAAKPDLFDPSWPVIRMLVVDPAARRKGLARLLTDECIRRARRDSAAMIALHTSPIMQVALAMYLRLGFVPSRDCPSVFGVPYRIYLKRLSGRARQPIAPEAPPQ